MKFFSLFFSFSSFFFGGGVASIYIFVQISVIICVDRVIACGRSAISRKLSPNVQKNISTEVILLGDGKRVSKKCVWDIWEFALFLQIPSPFLSNSITIDSPDFWFQTKVVSARKFQDELTI